ncbi:MAG: lipoate--protein ligase family protein [Chloroflexi bacterium]|nr:lipoate--protein ligase family protein [Chloroflexota bacterium]
MLFAEWRLIFTGAADGYVNMAIDEATLILVGEGRVPPTVRIYSWDSPFCTVGYLQCISQLKPLLSQSSGCKYVRRLTGGKACLHGGDLSYSLIVSMSDTLIPASVLDSYERISSGVIEGLRLLGFDARYAPPTDVQIDGHIIATSAQARKQGVLLHQGTIALKPCPIDRLQELPCLSLMPISELVGGEINIEDGARALGMGFKRALGVDLSPSILFAKEKRLARQLLREKYMRAEWTFCR